MYKCDICGRESNKKISMKGYILCSKHMHQLHSHGKFLDCCPRTQNDLNQYYINGDETIVDLYDGITSEKIDEFIIDTEDLHLIKYHKWRLSHGRVITGLPAQGTQRELSWVILNLDNRNENNKKIVVDHIDGNPKNNKKSNLRICEQRQNVLNKNFMSNNTSGFIGVSYRADRNRWDPEIRLNGIRCHLGYTKSLEDAVYKRMLAEKKLFGIYADEVEYQKKYEFTKNLSKEKKIELLNIVKEKLMSKKLWQ